MSFSLSSPASLIMFRISSEEFPMIVSRMICQSAEEVISEVFLILRTMSLMMSSSSWRYRFENVWSTKSS